MGTKEKALRRLKSLPRDYTYTEAEHLLRSLGFKKSNKGKTYGSRISFYRESDKMIVMLHRPHPGNVMLPAAVLALKSALEKRGEFDVLQTKRQ